MGLKERIIVAFLLVHTLPRTAIQTKLGADTLRHLYIPKTVFTRFAHANNMRAAFRDHDKLPIAYYEPAAYRFSVLFTCKKPKSTSTSRALTSRTHNQNIEHVSANPGRGHGAKQRHMRMRVEKLRAHREARRRREHAD
jgi:hypothetical protein